MASFPSLQAIDHPMSQKLGPLVQLKGGKFPSLQDNPRRRDSHENVNLLPS